MCVLSDKEIIEEIGEKDGIVPFIDAQVKVFSDDLEDAFDKNMLHYANYIGIDYTKIIPSRKIISYGLSSYGYDVRLDKHFKVFHNAHSVHIDPRNMDESSFMEVECNDPYPSNFILIPPNSFVLCQTMEWLRIPKDCLAFVAAKSTYARCGIVVNATVLEPGWEGTVTLELSNTTTLPARIYVGEGIVQVVYIRGSKECEISYADRRGKYMNQLEVTLSKV